MTQLSQEPVAHFRHSLGDCGTDSIQDFLNASGRQRRVGMIRKSSLAYVLLRGPLRPEQGAPPDANLHSGFKESLHHSAKELENVENGSWTYSIRPITSCRPSRFHYPFSRRYMFPAAQHRPALREHSKSGIPTFSTT